ncbi:SPOSA6832_02784 [Sporobolomyces salmonicolor]|uniref:SPOSA6832_02784-mRNA-1:cds n=1 Tax=Sporidiobolus salmonicolor TaxID=5005 RepID=A0A0D6EM80_SPOSA|nr:SPOSA6832_02784 [Sporobolomyces salmonicolor]
MTRTVLPLSLATISPSSFPSTGAFRGKLVRLTSISHHSRIFSFVLTAIDDLPVELEVELRGTWATAVERKVRKGEVVVLMTVGGRVVEARKGADKGAGKEGEPGFKVVYDRGLLGWVQRKDGQEEELRFKRSDAPPFSPKAPAANSASAPRSRAPATAKKATPASHTKPATSDACTQTSTPDERSAPAVTPATTSKRPADSFDMSISPSAPPTVPAPTSVTIKAEKVSAPFEGIRSIKRRKQEAKLEWGLTIDDGIVYTAFSKLSEVPAASDGKRTVNIAAVVVEVGEPCSPRLPGRDYYRRIVLVDPTICSSPAPASRHSIIVLQWYAQAESALPDVDSGDILLVRSLLVCSAGVLAFASAGIAAKSNIAASTKLHPSPSELDYLVRLARFFQRRALPAVSSVPPSTEWAGRSSGAFASTQQLRHTQSQATRTVQPALNAAQLKSVELQKGPKRGRQLLRVDEIEVGNFCDLLGMVTKCHIPSGYAIGSVPTSMAVSLYITDYTSQASLFAYTDPSSTGLSDQLTLQVSLFGYQSEPLQSALARDPTTGWTEVKKGTLVHLRNVRIKENEHGMVEGTMVEERDNTWRHKRDLTVVNLRREPHEAMWGKRARELFERHKKYWAGESAAK